MISDNNKHRLQELAGILTEGIKLVPDNSGRSDKNTLGWFIEEYILNISTLIINTLDADLMSYGNKLAISKSATKMQENSLATKLIINDSQEYILTGLVNFTQGSNTSFSVSHKGLTEQFNLNSQHAGNDVNLFVKEVVTYFVNSMHSAQKTKHN